MAIHRLLQKSAVGPEDTKRMSDAYELSLASLGLRDRNDPLTEIIAQHVFEIAQAGEKDPKRVCVLTLERLRK